MAENKMGCDAFIIDELHVQEAKNTLSKTNIESVSLMFKSIADINRAKITYLLCVHDELCVCDLAEVLNLTVANTSHHLRLLYKNGVVTYRKEGKRAFYRIYDEHIRQIMMISIAHKEEVMTDDNE
ncbi:transcriptional regulator [Staphylococcus muscae]|uniref:Cadmium efflux system accessory protein n=1 Tax=Staphylococcus muscae TaxID=1294 RepID=A0A240C3U5_9STAP|nr:metalloregulator ArsR/SmtB family transcription factor [Staphylococcus muscae]AVQ32902.1 transcriptional regulator [Staphylococcus muscae]PNZ06038.1 transcriptional regulator [Staphylococcus muscae]GGA80220.1 transcriptional regulator [Staphylococcus muscae]SNW01993.1 cadmium efflux system accessory protein [Staphylococcus muscae]